MLRQKSKQNKIVAVVIIIGLVFSVLWLRQTLANVQKANADGVQIAEKLEKLKAGSTALKAQIDSADDITTIEAIARERLGLILPGEIVFKEK
ncbi:MAG: septum formation initiator family protein [Oscillospiraceae bacterium]|nr:septum formation initiator family protein [Oscillospiraceae bacterium]